MANDKTEITIHKKLFTFVRYEPVQMDISILFHGIINYAL